MTDCLKHTTIPIERAWNTWDGERPAEMVFLPLGLRVTPMAYAASTKRATVFPPGPALRFGPRTSDASHVRMGLSHAGTTLDFAYDKAGPFDLIGRWTATKLGEWGLRFWMVIALSSEDDVPWTYDPDTETLAAAFGHRHVAVKGVQAPLLVTAHDSLAGITAEYERHGYWHLASRATAGTVMALRYHLEEMPEFTFAVAVRDDARLARERVAELVRAHKSVHASTPHPGPLPTKEGTRAAPLSIPSPPLPWGEGRGEGLPDAPLSTPASDALAAIRDVMGWNTVFDRINRRPYVSISRNWNQEKFGGFGVWLNDQQYASYLVGLLDEEQGRENQAVWLAGATPQGNLPCLITAKDAWVDRNQLPIGSYLTWLGFLRNQSRPMLHAAFATLVRNHAWWWQHRDPKRTGLVSFGNSAVGTGLYRGTNIGARDESSMDNSPMHDGARLDKAAGTLDQWDVGLNAMLALDAEMLANIATELGQTDICAQLTTEAAELRTRMATQLWDETRGIFANKLWSGQFARSVTPTSFWPLLCGAASPAQAKRLLQHLADPKSFGGAHGLPSVSRDDPAIHDNVYWRGRVWPPLNWTVWQGLRRYGFDAEAADLAAKSWALFSRAWDKDRLCAENYSSQNGEVLDQPDTDGFYSWGALMPAMTVAEVMDVSAWTGWTIRNDGKDLDLGPLQSPIGEVTLRIRKAVLTLMQAERPVLATNIQGRLENLRIGPGLISMSLPAGLTKGGDIRLFELDPTQIVLSRQGRRDVAVTAVPAGIGLAITPTGTEREPLTVVTKAG
jgi:putative isomerase